MTVRFTVVGATSLRLGFPMYSAILASRLFVQRFFYEQGQRNADATSSARRPLRSYAGRR
jgi:hypothetical protein